MVMRKVGANLMMVMAWGWMGASEVKGQEMVTLDALRRMGPSELEAVYRGGAAVAIPPGRVRGTALLAPGRVAAESRRGAQRLMWQGKIIEPDQATAVNRFFGVRIIRGQLYQGSSWVNGGPALILDYSQTSRIYARNRDEIRQVVPGLYLGVMHDRTVMPPRMSMYFALESR